MTKKSISSRIKVTKTGKLIRRKMGQGHFKTKRNGKGIRLKRKDVIVDRADRLIIKKYL